MGKTTDYKYFNDSGLLVLHSWMEHPYAVSTRLVYDDSGRVVTKYSSWLTFSFVPRRDSTVQHFYYHTSGSDEAVVIPKLKAESKNSNSITYFYQEDHLIRTIQLLGSSGYLLSHYEYDSMQRLYQKKDSFYNHLDSLTKVVTYSWQYDTQGNITDELVHSGLSITSEIHKSFYYSTNGRINKIKVYHEGCDSSIQLFKYEKGRLRSTEYWQHGKFLSKKTTYHYKHDGRLRKEKHYKMSYKLEDCATPLSRKRMHISSTVSYRKIRHKKRKAR